MALYFLSYDLRNSRDYKTLYEELDNFNAKRIVESTYCFERSNTSVSTIREHFKKYIDSDDGLMVSEVSYWASFKVENTPKDL